jgi:hypothetical protein
MSSNQSVALSPTEPDMLRDPPLHSLEIIPPGCTKELYPGWRSRWVALGRGRRGPGTLQRDLDGSKTLVGLTAREIIYIKGESR